MDLNIERIEQAVVEQALDRLFEQGNLHTLAKAQIEERVNKLWATHGEAQVMAAIDQAVKAGFEHEYVKVSSFGKSEGEPTTLAKELELQVQTYWQTKVDNSGNPSTGYGAKLTRAEWLMGRMVGENYREHFTNLVSSCAGQFKDELRRSLIASTNDIVSQVFKVTTPTDQAISNERNPEAQGKPVAIPAPYTEQELVQQIQAGQMPPQPK